MRNKQNLLLLIKNIALVCMIASICWLGAKVVRLFTMYNSGIQFLSEAEWENMKRITVLDKSMMIVCVVTLIIVIVINKLRQKMK